MSLQYYLLPISSVDETEAKDFCRDDAEFENKYRTEE